MRSKAPLAMMEQMVMLLVFALAAALCLQAFVKSDQMSKRMEAQDRAATLCQSAAEAIRSTRGDFERAAERLDAMAEQDSLTLFYDENWKAAVPESPNVYPMGYTLGACRVESGVPGLGKAEVWVQEDQSGEELFRLETAWQEVSAHG